MGYLEEFAKALSESSGASNDFSTLSSASGGKSTSSTSQQSYLDEFFKQRYLNGVGNSLKSSSSNRLDFYKKKKKKKNDDESTFADVVRTRDFITKSDDDDDDGKRTWFNKSDALDDGFQWTDIFPIIGGTAVDVVGDVSAAILGLGEKAADTFAMMAPYVAKTQALESGAYYNPELAQRHEEAFEESKAEAAKFVAKDWYDENKLAAKWIVDPANQLFNIDAEKVSVLGERSDALVQSAGQLAAQYGLTMVGVPWFVTAGVSAFGSEAESALNEGASIEEAGLSGMISAGAEIISELLFGGDLFTGKTGSDLATTVLSRSVADKGWRTFLKLGGDAIGEGFEEIFAEVMGNLGSSLYKEENLKDILFNEEALDAYIESFIGGAVMGGAMGGINAYKSGKAGVDFGSGMRDTEKTVVDSEYQRRLAEAEKGGTELTFKQKNQLYNDVVQAMDRGDISIDAIEEALGGETYSNYRDTVAQEKEFDTLYQMKQGDMTGQQIDRLAELRKKLANTKSSDLRKRLSAEVAELAKGTRLSASYVERARRGEAFQADVTQYDAKQRAIVQRAIDSGILNNTYKTHQFVDTIAKISADKGVSFDFTNNARLKESGFAIDGKTVNGYVTKDGIFINIDSPKAWQATVGHEITHVLEGTELYSELQKAVFEYAQSRGEYHSRWLSIKNTYSGVEGLDINSELTADLVGEYLFSDTDFVNNLSANHRNIFQKIYDEIKYLGKVVTAGSKEARQLERVKKAFEDAYRTGGKTQTVTQYSLSAVDTVQPTSEKWSRGFTAEDVRAVDSNFRKSDAQNQYVEDANPDYAVRKAQRQELAQRKAAGKRGNGTQRANTAITYDKIYDTLEKEGFNGTILDASSGLGIGTDHGIQRGFDVEDIEPYFGEGYKPIYSDYSRLDKQYDVVISSAVINVLTQEDSDAMVTAIGNALKPGGRAFITVRSATSVDGSLKGGSAIRLSENAHEWYVPGSDNYQRGFETEELKAYLEDVLGEGYTVTSSPKCWNAAKGKWEKWGDTSALVTKKDSVKYSLSDSDGRQLSTAQAEYFKDSKMRDDNGNLKVMYHGSQDAGFHVFDSNKSDDGTSFFFVDRNEVAASYSGTTETYEAMTIRTAEDMNNFLAEIGYDSYEAVEQDGKFVLLENGEYVATSDTAQGIYEEFCWYEGVGEGDVNYKVYLNLTNPMEVDAQGRNWNNVSREYSQEVADRYNSLSDAEKAALHDVAGWGEISIFRDAKNNPSDAILESAFAKMGDVNIYDLFSIAEDNFSEDSINQFAVKQMNTRDYAQKAKAEGYDGVIFRNIHDNGGYSNGSEGASTVAIAFDSNQIKSVANANPTSDPDIRYSVSEVTDAENQNGLDAHSELSYSISNDTKYADSGIALNKKTGYVADEVMNAQKVMRERVAGRLREMIAKGVALPKDVEGNTFFSNSSYGGSEENTTICPRSLAPEAFMDAVSEFIGRPLTVEEQIYVSQDLMNRMGSSEELRGQNFLAQCVYCYVAADRMSQREFLGEYVNQRDSFLKKVTDDIDISTLSKDHRALTSWWKDKKQAKPELSPIGQLYSEFLNGRKPTGATYKRVKMWLDAYRNGNPMIDGNHLANIDKLVGDISQFGDELKPQIQDAWKYAQSASWAKKRVGYVAYNGHIQKWTQKKVDDLNKHYGLRMYSFSDFHPAFVLENMQMVSDAAVRGLKMLGYTKDIDFVEIFAPSGMNINVSTFGFEKGGSVYEDNRMGAEWEKAQDLRTKYPNVGITFVATNDTMVKWALKQDWIDVVIPYHIVKTGEIIAQHYGYQNYTTESSDTKKAVWKQHKGWSSSHDSYIAPPVHNNDLDTYLSALENNGLEARFKRFLDDPETRPFYMKLVNECRQRASESQPVQPVFDEDAINRTLAKLESTGYYTPIGGSVDRMYEIAGEVAEAMTNQLAPAMSLSNVGEQHTANSLSALRLEVPVAENATTTPTVSEKESVDAMFPDDGRDVYAELEELEAEEAELRGVMEAYAGVGDAEAVNKLIPEHDAILERIKELQQPDNERADSLTDADAPMELDAPIRMKSENYDPLAGTTIADISRSTRSYSDQNPGARRFLEEAALGFVYDVNNSTHGERWYNDELYYESGGEEGFGGTSRHTTPDIADLKDTYGYTWDELRKAAEDVSKGDLRSVAAKRVEFLCHQRLMEGYIDVDGRRYEPNQEYIGFLNETFANEQRTGSIDNLLQNADQYAPEDVAPLNPATPDTFDAPIFESKDPKAVKGQTSLLDEKTAPIQKNSAAESTTTDNSTRKDLHGRIVDGIKATFKSKGFDFDEVLKKAKDLSTWSTVDNTPQRVMEKALGYKEGNILADITVNRVAQNESQGIKWLNSFTDRKNGLLAQISKQYNIKPGSKKSAAAQMYAEGFFVDDNNNIVKYGDRELAIDFPSRKDQENIKGLARDPRIRKIYDITLASINASRVRNLYPEIPRLDNYFLHFRAMEDTFSTLGLPFNPNDIRAKDLPTDLNGVTADLKPGQPFFASAMHRTGKRTSFDLLGGLERYLTSAKNQIYHIDDIQTLRALRNYIADTYGQANGLEGLDVLSEVEAQERIKQVYSSHLSTFAKFLNEEANVLAGKTALIDRGLEGIIGRRGITFLNTLNQQVGSNMVGYNVSSAGTNFLPVVQAFAKSNKYDFVKGFAQTVSNKVGSIFGKGDTFAENSPVMIRRKGADRFYRTPWQKMADPGYALMGAVDEISTELIARAKYNEFIRKGMSEQQAHFETDKWVSRLMGDRSIGQQPQLYNSKMLGLVTKFQLEVRNQLDSQFYDTIQETKASNEDIQNGLLRNAKTAAKVGSTFFQLAVLQHMYGLAYESLAGYNPAFDIIDVLIKALGFDDEEDSEDTVLDNIEEGFFALMEDMPYASIVTGGGRIPISSALPIEEFFKGEDQYGNKKSRWEILGEVAPYYVMPGGYGQLKKTVQGLKMFSDEHPMPGSYTDSGNLRFPVEDTPWSRVKAAIFGQYANDNARQYFSEGRRTLNPDQTAILAGLDIPVSDYWNYLDNLYDFYDVKDYLEEAAESDDATVADALKSRYINSVYSEVYALYEKQKEIAHGNSPDKQAELRAIQQQIDDLLNNSQYGIDNVFVSGAYAEVGSRRYNQDAESGYWYEIKPTNADGSDNWYYQKEQEVTKGLGISYEDYWNNREEYNFAYDKPGKYLVAQAVGGYSSYVSYSDALYNIKADKDKNGKSISGSRKDKVIAYLNGLDADMGTKMILFKNEYNADDTYNYDIVAYLNGRDDLSYADKVVILKEIGFDVDSDGNVTW